MRILVWFDGLRDWQQLTIAGFLFIFAIAALTWLQGVLENIRAENEAAQMRRILATQDMRRVPDEID